MAAANLLPKFGASVAIPLPIDEAHPAMPAVAAATAVAGSVPLASLCSRRCLVMDRLNGESLLRLQRSQLERAAAAANMSAAAMRRHFEAQLRSGKLCGTLLLRSSMAVRVLGAWLRMRDICINLAKGVADVCDDLAAGLQQCWLPAVTDGGEAPQNISSVRSYIDPHAAEGTVPLPGRTHRQRVRTPLPINAPRLIRILFDCFGHQLLHDGVFNGDPHPGETESLRA